jgi:hypothetical protein
MLECGNGGADWILELLGFHQMRSSFLSQHTIFAILKTLIWDGPIIIKVCLKNMKRSLIVFLFVAVAGCSSKDRPIQKKEFLNALTNGVVSVAFGDVDEVETTNSISGALACEYHFREIFKVTDRQAVSDLLSELVQINKHGDKSMESFSGTLPYIVFVREDGSVAGDVAVACNDSSIGVYQHCFIKNSSIRFGKDHTLFADGINRDFVRMVYRHLQEHAPQEIKDRDILYKNVGFTNGLYQVLGLDK